MLPLPTSSTPLVRRAGPADLPALLGLIERCSEGTLYRRFHGSAAGPIRRWVEHIANPTEAHRSWVALAGGDVRGTATLARGRDGSVEAAFLVEDAWFRRSIGRALFRALVTEARRHALTAVVATIQSDNDRAARFLRAMAPGGTYELTGPETVVTLPVGTAGRAAAGDLPATEAA